MSMLGKIGKGIARYASLGMIPPDPRTPPFIPESEDYGGGYDPEWSVTEVPSNRPALPPTPPPVTPPPSTGLASDETLAPPPIKRLDAREEAMAQDPRPLPGDYRSGSYKPASVKRQLLAGLLRLTPGVNMTSIPEDVASPGYRQRAMQWEATAEALNRKARLSDQAEQRELTRMYREAYADNARSNRENRERQARLEEQERIDRLEKERRAAGGEIVQVPEIGKEEDYSYEPDPMNRGIVRYPTDAKRLREKKQIEQESWRPLGDLMDMFPQAFPELRGAKGFRNPDDPAYKRLLEMKNTKVPPQVFDKYLGMIQAGQTQAANEQMRRDMQDRDIQARKDLAALRPTMNFVLPGMASGAAPSTVSGEEYLKKLDPGVANIVRQTIDGDLQLPSGNSRAPAAQQMRLAALTVDPTLNEQRYRTKTAYRDNKQNTPGGSLNSANTVIDHIGVMADIMDDIKNNRVQGINRFVNWVRKQTGDPRVTNAATATTAVANEMERLMRQAGTSDTGIESFKRGLSLIETSPEQAKGQIMTTLQLLGGRVGELATTYQRGMGRTETDSDRRFKLEFLSAKARNTLKKFGMNPDEMLGISSGSGDGSAVPLKDGRTATFKSPAEAAAFRRDHPELVK